MRFANCCVLVSGVHPVAILSAVFCVIICLISDANGTVTYVVERCDKWW